MLPFQQAPYEYSILDDGTAEIIKYIGNEGDLDIPTELDGHTVTSIGKAASKAK